MITLLLSDRLKQLRIHKGLTQEQLAKRLGVTRGALSMYESGLRQPSYDVLIEYSLVFNVSSDYILGVEHKRLIDATGLTDKEIQIVQDVISAIRNHR